MLVITREYCYNKRCNQCLIYHKVYVVFPHSLTILRQKRFSISFAPSGFYTLCKSSGVIRTYLCSRRNSNSLIMYHSRHKFSRVFTPSVAALKFIIHVPIVPAKPIKSPVYLGTLNQNQPTTCATKHVELFKLSTISFGVFSKLIGLEAIGVHLS